MVITRFEIRQLVVFGILRKWTSQPGVQSEDRNPTLSGGDRPSVI